jgi:ATP-dependent protease ClpP protease subunit
MSLDVLEWGPLKSDKQDEGAPAAPVDPIAAYGQVEMPKKAVNPRGNIYYLNIIGHIEGHVAMPPNNKTTKYEHVIPQLINAAEDPAIEGLLVLLNTVGGDVEAGLALAELIAHVPKPSVSLVLGGGHSIGVPLAVAADYSMIAPSATMTIHPVRLNGTIVGAPQTYDYFNKMQERVSDFIVAHSAITKERLASIMMDTGKIALDVGTVLIGEDAVREGLINQIGGLDDAMERLYKEIGDKRNAEEDK